MEPWAEPLCHALRRRVGSAVARWNMIGEGDNILIGLSGGKDSLVLLHALSDIRRRSPVKFCIAACTVVLTGMDVSRLRDYCAARDVKYCELPQPIMEIIEERGERSPCSFCANMRRGRLSAWAAENGFNKLALGHSLDDAVETFFLNLLHAGRARSFQPVAYMSRTGVTVIRPLALSTEAAIIDEARRLARGLGGPAVGVWTLRRSSSPGECLTTEAEKERLFGLCGAEFAVAADCGQAVDRDAALGIGDSANFDQQCIGGFPAVFVIQNFTVAVRSNFQHDKFLQLLRII